MNRCYVCRNNTHQPPCKSLPPVCSDCFKKFEKFCNNKLKCDDAYYTLDGERKAEFLSRFAINYRTKLSQTRSRFTSRRITVTTERATGELENFATSVSDVERISCHIHVDSGQW